MKIDNYYITNESSPFIIAEAGINHNGELKKMLEMVEVAKDCGADCIKFQTFKAEELCGDKQQLYTYMSQGKKITEPMYDMFKRVEVKDEYWSLIKEKCDEIGIVFLSTPQNIEDLELLLKVGISAIKVGSDDFITIPLLEKYKETSLPMILSCGMSDLNEIRFVMEHFVGYPIALLVCTSEYPTPYEDANLNRLKVLRNEFPNLILGFSDHTRGTQAAAVAAGAGAVIFEKHFTLSNNLAGPDHWFSSNPEELKNWCNVIKESYKLLGKGDFITDSEKRMQELARRKLIAKVDIKQGEQFTIDNIAMKRSSEGLNVLFYDKIINKIARKHIYKGSGITEECFDE